MNIISFFPRIFILYLAGFCAFVFHAKGQSNEFFVTNSMIQSAPSWYGWVESTNTEGGTGIRFPVPVNGPGVDGFGIAHWQGWTLPDGSVVPVGFWTQLVNFYRYEELNSEGGTGIYIWLDSSTAANNAMPEDEVRLGFPGKILGFTFDRHALIRNAIFLHPSFVPPAQATVNLSNLVHLADGTPKSASAITSPAGLSTSFTYNGSAIPPSAPGSYAVTATITSPGYTGSTTGTLTILGINVTYSSPTYPISTTPPTNVGSYTVTATTTGSINYSGFTTGTLVINPAPATFSISGTNQEWSGGPRSVTAAPTPSGVPMTITYNGSTTAPTDAGTYAVLVGPSSPNYTGAASATLFVRGRLTVASATGGSVTGGGLFLPGETAPISVTLDPLRTFNGWSLSAPNGGALLTGLATNTSNGVRMGSRSVTVTPGITAITYQVTVETSPVAAGGSTLPSGVFIANAGQTYAVTAAQGSGNWYFSGWSVVSGPATLTANTPTDADPTPVANVSVTGNAVIRANYSAKAPTSITFSTPGTNGTMPLASTPYPLVATADSGAAVSFSLLSTAPAGIATLAGSTITHRAPPLAGTVNLRMTAPATRTQLAASLDASYQIADGAVGLVFMQAAQTAMAFSEETQGSSNFTPVRPNDYSEPQYLTAAKAQANVAHFKQDGRLMSDAEILAKIQAEPTLKGQMANWLSGQGVQTDYAIALNNQNQPNYTYTSATLNGAPSPTGTGQTLSVTGTGMVYDSYWDFSANRWKWRAR